MHFQGVFVETHCAFSHACAMCQQVIRHVPEEHHFHIETAFRELIANAVNASKIVNGRVSVDFYLTPISLTVIIVNTGVNYFTDPESHRFPGNLSEHGRGIPMAYSCCDQLSYARTTEKKTRVTAVWDLRKRRH